MQQRNCLYCGQFPNHYLTAASCNLDSGVVCWYPMSARYDMNSKLARSTAGAPLRVATVCTLPAGVADPPAP